MLDKKYYQQLNESIQVNKAYQYYEGYRIDLTGFIKDVIKRYKSKNIVVFGAGNLMDIDYPSLRPLLSEITLTDIDEKAIKRGLEFYKLNHAGFKYACFDYLKIGGGDDYHDEIDLARQNEIDRDRQNEIDLALVCPIHTQFYNYHSYQGEDLQAMIGVIDDFNKKVINTLKKGGILIVLADIMEVTRQEFMKSDKNKLITKKWIEETIRKYEETYGYGLGSYGLYSFQQLGNSIGEEYFHWQFDKKRHFLVKGLLIQKQDYESPN